MYASTLSSFSFSVIHAQALQYLWGTINAIKIIIFTYLYKLQSPENVRMVMIKIWEILTFDILDSEYLVDYLFSFRETRVFIKKYDADGMSESVFEDAGFDSSNFIMLTGPVIILLLSFLLLVALKSLLKLVTKKCNENCLTKRLRRNVSFKAISLRFMMEACLDIGLSTVISILMVSNSELLSLLTL